MKAPMPMTMPNGVVMANNIDNVGFSQENVRGGGALEEDKGDAGGELGTGDCTGVSAAIRMPRDSPSKSWWNVIAVTRDTSCRKEERKAGSMMFYGRT